MSSYRLLVSIVPHDKGEKLTRAAMESGCRGGTVLMGRGLARSNFITLYLLRYSSKDGSSAIFSPLKASWESHPFV